MKKPARWLLAASVFAPTVWMTAAFADPPPAPADPAPAAAEPEAAPAPADPATTAAPVASGATPLDTSDPARDAPKPKEEDPTGGAYTSPTLLFVPAAALPKWTARATLSTDFQSHADYHAGIRPGIGAEVGLPGGVTMAAGTNWVGGDVNPDTGKNQFSLGLSPYFQARLHLYGRKDGMGLQVGTGAAYKFVGFGGNTSAGQDPGEMELMLTAQYRHTKYEMGLMGAVGQDFGDSKNHDGEIHAYALYRVIPQLGVGAAGQVRMAIAPDLTDPKTPPAYTDIVGGALASLTVGRYQLGTLLGASTIGVAPDRPTVLAAPGFLAQVFGTVRIN